MIVVKTDKKSVPRNWTPKHQIEQPTSPADFLIFRPPKVRFSEASFRQRVTTPSISKFSVSFQHLPIQHCKPLRTCGLIRCFPCWKHFTESNRCSCCSSGARYSHHPSTWNCQSHPSAHDNISSSAGLWQISALIWESEFCFEIWWKEFWSKQTWLDASFTLETISLDVICGDLCRIWNIHHSKPAQYSGGEISWPISGDQSEARCHSCWISSKHSQNIPQPGSKSPIKEEIPALVTIVLDIEGSSLVTIQAAGWNSTH